jgi:hypothetical protein
VFQQGVASSSLRVWHFIRSDLILVLVFIVIQPLEACSLLLEHFVAASILLLEPSVEHSRSASSL